MIALLIALGVIVVTIVVVVASRSEETTEAPEGFEETTAQDGRNLADDSFYRSQPGLFTELLPQDGDYHDKVQVKFLGVNGLYISDHSSTILIDPFFTRPKLGDIGRIHGNNHIPVSRSAVEYGLKAAGLDRTRIDAILVTHTHYDHAMDIAEVWRKTGRPAIVGSESMKNIVAWSEKASDEYAGITDAWQLPTIMGADHSPFTPYTDSWASYQPPTSLFTVKFVRGYHLEVLALGVPFPGTAPTDIDLPAQTQDYTCGIISSLLIEHPRHESIFVQGSAGYKPNMNTDQTKVPTLILGVGGRDHGIFTGNTEGFVKESLVWKPDKILLSHWDDYDRAIWQSPMWVTECWKVRNEFINQLQIQGYSKDEIDVKFMRIFGDVYLS